MKTHSINNITFGSSIPLSPALKIAKNLIAIQEGGSGLSHVKFFQDTMTGLAPKAAFARSKADLCENSFLELSESLLVYYGTTLLGEKLFRKLFSKGLPETLKSKISTPAVELLAKKLPENKLLMPVKAALALSCFAIPLTEFALNYIKNLMTLKVFKKGNFENIANLDKGLSENTEANKKIERSAKNKIKTAISIFAGCLGISTLLLKKGANSKTLQNISEAVLAPGSKFFKEGSKKADFFNKYFSLDFANNNGKLALSKGQLTSCVLVGSVGYFGSANDRGKQNLQEVLFRFPPVGFYIICGNELLEHGFKKLLQRFGKCKDVIGKNLEVTKLKDIDALAQKISFNKNADYNEVYKKLLKQKSLLTFVPLLFGIGVMGFFIAGSSRLFTQYRYDRAKTESTQSDPFANFKAQLK